MTTNQERTELILKFIEELPVEAIQEVPRNANGNRTIAIEGTNIILSVEGQGYPGHPMNIWIRPNGEPGWEGIERAVVRGIGSEEKLWISWDDSAGNGTIIDMVWNRNGFYEITASRVELNYETASGKSVSMEIEEKSIADGGKVGKTSVRSGPAKFETADYVDTFDTGKFQSERKESNDLKNIDKIVDKAAGENVDLAELSQLPAPARKVLGLPNTDLKVHGR